MTRETKTADELRQMVQERMDQRTTIDSDSVVVEAVYQHESDETGCNWNITGFQGDRSWYQTFTKILYAVRKEYNLATD